MVCRNPLRQVSTLLGQFTILQKKLATAVEAIRTRRQNHREAIIALEIEVSECDAVIKQAKNAIVGIDNLLSGK